MAILPILRLLAIAVTLTLIGHIFFYIKKLNIVNVKIEKGLEKYGLSNIGKRRMRQAWIKVEKQFKTAKPDKIKEAISGADKILAELVKFRGIPGKSVEERINNLENYSVSDLGKIKYAREIAQKISKKEEINITYDESREIIEAYKKALWEISRLEEI